ncbi:hypothetical protein V8E36_008183 [Tilletia maclaganii]
MEISITPATPAQDPEADITFPPSSSSIAADDADGSGARLPHSSSSSSNTTIINSTTAPITPITLSSKLTDIASAIEDVRVTLFQIQEQRHLKSFSTVTSHQQQQNGSSPNDSTAAGTSPGTGASTGAGSELDRALIQLDTQLTTVSQAMIDAEKAVDTLLRQPSTAADASDGSTDDQPEHLRDIARMRRDSRASLSSLASFDDILLQTGSSLASYAPAFTPAQVQQRFQDLQAEWLSVTSESDTLKRELSEDKYLLVFRSVSDQADTMMTSLHKAITLSQDFIAAFRASQQQQQQLSASNSTNWLSLDGNDTSPEAQLDELRALKKTFNVKTSYYGPACEQVFHVLERGIKDKATSNGTILHRYADLKMRWKSTRDSILRTDRDLTKIERHLCKTLGLEVPAYSKEVQQYAAASAATSATAAGRQRQDSNLSNPSASTTTQSTSATSTPPRLQPKSSARTLRHMPSSTPSTQSFADSSFGSSSVVSGSHQTNTRSPPPPTKPPRSELRRLSSSQRIGGPASAAGSPARAIPIQSSSSGRNQSQGGVLTSQLSSSVGSSAFGGSRISGLGSTTAAGSGLPHRRSISASINEPMADVGFRRQSLMIPSDRPPIPARAGSRTGSRTPLGGGGSSSNGGSNPFKHTGSEYSYAALTAGRNLGGLGGGGAGSPHSQRRVHSPTHPPSSYRMGPGSSASGSGSVSGSASGPQAGVIPRRSKTPQPSGYGSSAAAGGGAAGNRSSIYGRLGVERGASEPPEGAGLGSRPASRTSGLSRYGAGAGSGVATGSGAGTIRASDNGASSSALGRGRVGVSTAGPGARGPSALGRGRVGAGSTTESAAFDNATEDLSLESYDGPPSPVGVRQRPASSMATYYHPPAAHGHRPPDSHIPRLAIGGGGAHQHQQGHRYGGSATTDSPAASLSSLPGRPGSALSQASNSTTGGAGAGIRAAPPPRNGGYPGGASRLTMQTPEPALAAQVKRLSLFARPSQGGAHYPSYSSYTGAASSSASTTTSTAAKRSSRPPPARLNQPSRTGRTTPLSAAALAAVPQANPALAWMRGDTPGGGGSGSGVGGRTGLGGIGAAPGSSPSHSVGGLTSSSSVAAFRAQRAAAALSPSTSGIGLSFAAGGGGGRDRGGSDTPLSESSFGGQSVGGWGVRPASYSQLRGSGAAPVMGAMSSVTGGAGGGAGSFDVYVPNPRDALDVAVAEVVNALGVAIERVDEPLPRGVRSEVAPGKDLQARYSIAGKTVQCKLLMLHRPTGGVGVRGAGTNVKKLLVRVGGGWQDFEGWISSSILGYLD